MNLDPMFQAVRRALVICREVQRHHIVENQKTGREPVTIADYGSQAVICEAIARHFPDDAVLAEESGQQFRDLVDDEQRRQIIQMISMVLGRSVTEDEVVGWLDYNKHKTADRTWVIDPIDGTKGFLALRHYVVAVGVLEGGQPTVGIIGAPNYPGYNDKENRGAIVHAIDGKCYIQPVREGGEVKEVQSTNYTDPTQVRVVESVEKSHASHDRMEKVREYAGLLDAHLDRVDSQEKYARIAAGDAELYLRLPRLHSTRGHSVWDHAAGAALVYAAGGKITDATGAPLDFVSNGKELNNDSVIVTNGAIHDTILDAIAKVMAEEKADESGE